MLFGDLCALSLCAMTKTKKRKKQSEELLSGVTSFFFSFFMCTETFLPCTGPNFPEKKIAYRISHLIASYFKPFTYKNKWAILLISYSSCEHTKSAPH
jgi:hypothetical protein